MTLGGHPFARSFRLVAWALMATCSILLLQPYAATAQPAAQPGPGNLPPGPEMTLDQAAPQVTPMPAPQGPIQRIVVEGTQRIEPTACFLPPACQGQVYDPAIADRSLKVLSIPGCSPMCAWIGTG
jgi:hypothetical protein